MKIAIAGAGVAGAYLYRLLRDEVEVHVYDKPHTTRCGISPCAWGTTSGFNWLLEQAGLDPPNYILKRIDHVIIDEIKVKLDLMTFNKPRLINDLLHGARIYDHPLDPLMYDRVIDATGTARMFLPPIKNDIILLCSQGRVHSDLQLECRVSVGYIGYAWCFPLSDNNYHIGYGSLTERSFHVLSDICRSWNLDSHNICGCEGKIRVTCPHYSTPFVDKIAVSPHDTVPVWGIGEAIGCVGPLAGDGIVPGMRSAQLLAQHWDHPEKYTHAILNEFKWMKKERHLLDRIARGDKPGLGDAWVFKNNAKRAGMKIGLRNALAVLKRLGNLGI